MKKSVLYMTLFTVLMSACTKTEISRMAQHAEPKLPATSFEYKNQVFDGNQSTADLQLSNVTNEKATLGRVLFYDTKLSVNNAISCGSCHVQSKAFADVSEFSSGFRGVKTSRNSPPTFNAGTNNRLFWDGRASSLHDQVLMPAFDHVEMGMSDIDQLVNKLQQIDYYAPLFEAAYPTEEGLNPITEFRVRDAISSFLKSMLSFNSKFDKAGGSLNQIGLGLNALEMQGADVFKNKARCFDCHSGSNMGTWGEANIGLELNYSDPGMGAIWDAEGLEGVFKIPSLRNLVFTAPYMHDGRFKTIEEVIEHYNSGIAAHPSLDSRLWQDPPFWGGFEEPFDQEGEFDRTPVRMGLTDIEKQALKAFLLTLTDYDLVNDPKFSDPFLYED